MFGIGGFELFLILLFGFLVFGPDKLPEIAKTVGKGIAKFRNAQEDMSEQLKGVSFMDKDSDEPFKNPLDVMEHAANDAKGKAEVAKGKAREAADVVTERAESFAERKARYDRERAAKRAAEQQQRAEASQAADAAAAKEAARRENPTADVAAKTLSEEED